MKTSITAALITAALVAFTSTTSAQPGVVAGPRPPPIPGQTVNLLYSNAGNDELGSEDAPFNSCFASENALAPFAYLTFAPKNATINFYKDSSCQEFTFALDGYYGGYPGQARSFRWVGWTEDSLGELFLKPIPGQGEAAVHPGGPAPETPPPGVPPTDGDGHPNNPPPLMTPDQQTGGGGNGTKYNTSSTFFGGVFGALVILSIGGLVFWKATGKKKEDKGKGLLPYSRGATRDDDDILLTTHSRSHLNNDENSFSIGDEEDSDDEEDGRHVRRQGQSNHDSDHDDEEEEDMHEQKHARPGQHDRYRDDDDHHA